MPNPRVIVIGGGAAGLLAAGRAAERGADVLLLEKMKRTGRKLRITGKGRCNLTNAAALDDFLPRFGKNGRFLRQAFSRFFSAELLDLFAGLGLETATERGGRIFPASGKATDVVDALWKWLRKTGVRVETSAPVGSLIVEDGHLTGLLPCQMVPVCLDATGIPPTRTGNTVSAAERRRLKTWLKDFRLEVTGHRPFSEAIVTAGGIDTRQVDRRTMESRLVRGLFIAGELLDLHADTGGYNFQAAFSTGWIAGDSVSTYCRFAPGHEFHGPYHDREYGFPLRDDRLLFGRLLLEINQAGLSWLTILKKKENFRRAYADFDIDAVAAYGEEDRARLLADPGIIRNRLKIDAAIHNARRLREIRREHGSFADWLDRHHPLDKPAWVNLFKKTFKFTGGEITGEFLMSTGYLPGAHEPTCPVYRKIAALNPPWMQTEREG